MVKKPKWAVAQANSGLWLWSEHEDLFLKHNAAPLKAEEIASELGRSTASVHVRARFLDTRLTGYKVKDAKEGEVFGDLTATSRHQRTDKNRLAETRCHHNGVKFCSLQRLRKGLILSCLTWRDECPVHFLRNGVEHRTVRRHHTMIFDSRSHAYENYKGMPFYEGWNPNKGGCLLSGAFWIAENLGRRPEGCTLHVLPTGKGFVPGNLVWAPPKQQSQEQWFKRVAQLEHKNEQLKNALEVEEFLRGLAFSELAKLIKEK